MTFQVDQAPMLVADYISFLVETEAWAPVGGWPGYWVSAKGRVSGPKSKILAPVDAGYGYFIVSLVRDGLTSNHRINRLVALSFLGPAPFDGALVAHNDGDKANNVLSNLRWASALENQADRGRHATKIQGSMMKHAKLVEGNIPEIRSRALSGENYEAIARDFGVSISTVSLIKRGKIWRHVPA